MGDWLKLAEGNQVCITRAQSEAEAELEVDDQKALVESQASLHLLGDVFDFDSEFFQDHTAHAIPPYPPPSILPLPNLAVDTSDRALLIKQQEQDPSL